MKRFILLSATLLFLLFVTACSNQEVADDHPVYTQSAASWAYAFVKYDGVSYELTDEEISKENVGDILGHVKRNVADMDAVDHYVETDLDSNELLVGTSLFAIKGGDDNQIIYERYGKYFFAKKSL